MIDAFFEALAKLIFTADFIQIFASTVVRARVSAARAKRGSGIKRSTGYGSASCRKFTSKTDFCGLSLAFVLTVGEAGDSQQFETLPDLGPDIRSCAAIIDKGYHSKSNRTAARIRGAVPIIRCKTNAKKRLVFFPKALYRNKTLIEQAFGIFECFKNIGLRCEKTKANFSALASLALAFIFIKSVHTFTDLVGSVISVSRRLSYD